MSDTPITDATTKYRVGNTDQWNSIVPASTARDLERDRAALIRALEDFVEEQCEERPSEYSPALGSARQALAAARERFPELTKTQAT